MREAFKTAVLAVVGVGILASFVAQLGVDQWKRRRA